MLINVMLIKKKHVGLQEAGLDSKSTRPAKLA